MDTAQWPQEIVVKPYEEIVVPIPNTSTLCAPKLNSNGGASNSNGSAERKPRPQKEQALNCPRCNSTNTKFCYYNNYSLTQPRYFCKTCRRYWTEGGSLRNIPVGGGSRKNKGRPSSSSSSATSSSSTSAASSSSAPPTIMNHLLDPRMRVSSSAAASGAAAVCNGTQNPSKGQDHLNIGSPLDLLNSKGLLSSFMSMPLSAPHDPTGVYTPPPPPPPHGLFPGFHEMKPSATGLGFSLDVIGGGFRSALQESAANIDNGGGRLLFPFEELKQTNDSVEQQQDNRSGDHHHQQQHQQQQHESAHHQHHHPNGFWSGMLGGGSW